VSFQLTPENVEI